ncbi:hypothetical protein PENTCL1PPCAC_9500, partial [Pristionchus entomophagus]
NEVEPRSRRLEEANRPMINIYFPKQVEERMQLLIDQLKVQNAAHERIRRSTFCPTPFEQPKMQDFGLPRWSHENWNADDGYGLYCGLAVRRRLEPGSVQECAEEILGAFGHSVLIRVHEIVPVRSRHA